MNNYLKLLTSPFLNDRFAFLPPFDKNVPLGVNELHVITSSFSTYYIHLSKVVRKFVLIIYLCSDTFGVFSKLSFVRYV